jgi:hypothetical protein
VAVRRRGHAHTQKHALLLVLAHQPMTLCVAVRRSGDVCSGGGARSLQLLNIRLSASLIKIKSCFALL